MSGTTDETSRQRAVRLRLSGRSLAEVGEQMGISRQRVEQLTRGELISVPGLNLTKEEGQRLAERYEHEKHEDPVTGETESLSAWLRRLWIGEVDHKDCP